MSYPSNLLCVPHPDIDGVRKVVGIRGAISRQLKRRSGHLPRWSCAPRPSRNALKEVQKVKIGVEAGRSAYAARLEDDALLGLDIAQQLADAGLQVVGPAISVAKALRLME
jgi:hypothetical protein